MNATSPVEEQLDELLKTYPEASIRALPDGSQLVTVPNVPLPDGWNQAYCQVKFILPIGFPMAKPDCFWTDPSLQLANGGQPQNTNPQVIPGTAESALWFSWHIGAWNPLRDSISTYVRVIRDRFMKRN